MSNAVTALKGVKSQGYVAVAEAPLTGMITLRGDFADSGFQSALKSVTDCDIPKTRQIEQGRDCNVLWMSPDELMVLCKYEEATNITQAFSDALGASHALIVNVSDARALFEINGDQVREVIAKLAPVDMSVFKISEIRRTRFAQVAAAFWMPTENSVRIICFRSVAQYMFDLLKASSKSGFEIGDW